MQSPTHRCSDNAVWVALAQAGRPDIPDDHANDKSDQGAALLLNDDLYKEYSQF